MTKLDEFRKLNEARTQGKWCKSHQEVIVNLYHGHHRMAFASNCENAAFIAFLANHADRLLKLWDSARTVAHYPTACDVIGMQYLIDDLKELEK